MKLSRELKTGVIAIVIIAVFIWGYNFLKGQNLFNKSPRTYFAEYNNVQGLNTASPVTINGLQVGKVVDIKFNNAVNKQGQLIVEFGIENDFQFSKQSIAKIYSASLMGGKSLAIVPSYEGENAVSGDFLTGQIESDLFSTVTETLNPLQSKLESVIVNADSLMLGLNQVLDKNTRANLKSTISNLNTTVSNFKKSSESLDQILVSNKMKLDNSLENVETITNNFSKISDSLANANLGFTIKKLQSTITNFDNILAEVDQGEGSIGKLLKDEGLYNNLENASKEMEELLREMKLHPKRFVHFSLFGKKAKEYNPEQEN
ncbi:MlaD family protein [Urechidicola croceus]|uniref:ABC transporter substrate-binding protein n=1 Tax=Urechidicola croceus TaxID=1850246 RepID=A0A1D8P6Q5_9FLAO|nr:MlaD family protein [Urechidicola croceus]AOW20248.1 ABC transporter substrate-binding protein [Urechidicola croceus]